jgi:hypothetical protein
MMFATITSKDSQLKISILKNLLEGNKVMKKIIVSLMVLFVLMIGLPLSTEAHPGCPRYSRSSRYRAVRTVRYVPVYQTRYVPRYQTARYGAPRYRSYAAPTYRTAGYSYQRPSFYRRHRNVINLGIATGGGALIGGIARGKRGAGIGGLIGAGSGALYTYVLNKKQRRY